MSYHIVSIDAPSCVLSCRHGQLTFRSGEERRSIPLEDVAAVVITSFSASIHSRLLIEAAHHGIGLVLCDHFKPVSLVLPANRCTDTLLTRAQLDLSLKLRRSLWAKTIDAKVKNQLSLGRLLAPKHPSLATLERHAASRQPHKEAAAARAFWNIFGNAVGHEEDFRRGRHLGSLNPLLNYGYAILLSTVLQRCFAVGIDPTFGIHHTVREQATPLAYDLLEPFRPCVDWCVTQWVRERPDPKAWDVSKEYRQWVTGFTTVKTRYDGQTLDLLGCIEGVVRSFRKAVIDQKSGIYKPWIQGNSKWAG